MRLKNSVTCARYSGEQRCQNNLVPMNQAEARMTLAKNWKPCTQYSTDAPSSFAPWPKNDAPHSGVKNSPTKRDPKKPTSTVLHADHGGVWRMTMPSSNGTVIGTATR